jgi:hypothetical protein
MQHHLSAHYECAWDIAEMVATHGMRNLGGTAGPSFMVAELCGVRVYFENNLPTRLTATDLDVTLDRMAMPLAFAAWLNTPETGSVHTTANANYTLCFRRGNADSLGHWAEQIKALIKSTSGHGSSFQKVA